MNKSLGIMTIIIVLVMSSMSHAQEKTFRDTTWGMNVHEVFKTEMSKDDVRRVFIKDTDIDEVLDFDLFKTKLFDDNVLIRYNFYGDDAGLTSASYLFDESDGPPYYPALFKRYFNKLTEIYGKHTSETINWRNEQFKGVPMLYDEAISSGHVEIVIVWLTQNTGICLTLYTDETFDPQLMIEYVSIKDIEKDLKRKTLLLNKQKAKTKNVL